MCNQNPRLRSSLHPPAMNNRSGAVALKLTTTAVHIMALDGVVNVNSLFTFAVFLGLALNPFDPNYTLVGDDPTCAAGLSIAEDFFSFHIYSFSSFLFSSLIACGLKQAIRIATKDGDPGLSDGGAEVHTAAGRVNSRILRGGILASATGSVLGCAFLTLALVELIQIKLGTLACGSFYTFGAVIPLVILVPSALLIYMFIVLHAFTR